MPTLQQLLHLAEQYGIPFAAVVVILFLRRWTKKNVGFEYGPEVLPTGEVRMRLSFYAKIPSNRQLPPPTTPTLKLPASNSHPPALDRDAA